MNVIRTLRERAGLTQAELAERAGTSQPTVAAYESGRKSPSLQTLRRLAESADLDLDVRFHPPLTRVDRRSIHLHRAIADRVAEDPEEILPKARRNLSRMRERNPGAQSLFREWDVRLDRPLEELLPLLTDPSPRARELRHVTPFAGILSAAERAEVYRSFRKAEEERHS